MGVRRAVAAAAFQIQRSFLASAENAREMSRSRQAVFAAAMQRTLDFTSPSTVSANILAVGITGADSTIELVRSFDSMVILSL
jgi:hypothetical protein